MLTTKSNFHHSKLPKLGTICIVRVHELKPGHRHRKFIVESYPLCDNVRPYSIGIHTVNLRALDNGEKIRVSGFYCAEVLNIPRLNKNRKHGRETESPRRRYILSPSKY